MSGAQGAFMIDVTLGPTASLFWCWGVAQW
jgi:hypothetical protein